MSIKFSLAIITLNEESNIERCIRSVPIADEIIVVDSGSTDRTLEIAKRLGARVSIDPWRGFAKQKTRAAALCRNQWVLSLDADEAMSPEALESLKGVLASEPNATAYSFPRLTHHMGQPLRNGGSYPDRQTRLFYKEKSKWSDTEVHEKIESEKIEQLKGDIFHWPFPTIESQIATINRYSGLRAKDWQNKGRKFHLSQLVLKPISKFFEVFIVKRGFRDGLVGFEVAVVTAFSYFLRLIKLKELQDRPANKTKSS